MFQDWTRLEPATTRLPLHFTRNVPKLEGEGKNVSKNFLEKPIWLREGNLFVDLFVVPNDMETVYRLTQLIMP